MKSKLRKRLGIGSLLVLLAGFGLYNVVAWHHAYAMMHYSRGGTRTAKPERLSPGQKARVLLLGVTLPRPETGRLPSEFGLPFEERTIACSNGVRLSAWSLPQPGAGTLVILFHGYGSEKSKLLTEAKLLRELGHAVLLVDFRGSGGSSESLTTVGFLEAEDVAHAVAYARAQFPHARLILFGQSMGAVAILRAIDRFHVEPDGIILEAVFDTLLNTVKNRFHAMGVPSFPSAQLLLFWGGRQMGFDAFSHRPVDYARAVRCPALVMQGDRDPRARPEEARRVFDAIHGPKRWTTFGDVGHESYASRYPGEWRAAVEPFIAGCGTGILTETPTINAHPQQF